MPSEEQVVPFCQSGHSTNWAIGPVCSQCGRHCCVYYGLNVQFFTEKYQIDCSSYITKCFYHLSIVILAWYTRGHPNIILQDFNNIVGLYWYATQNLLRITFSVSGQLSTGKCIFKFLVQLCLAFINFRIFIHLSLYISSKHVSEHGYPEFAITRNRVGGLSGCTFTITLFLRNSLLQKCFFFWISKG